jgi:hypothetical protein
MSTPEGRGSNAPGPPPRAEPLCQAIARALGGPLVRKDLLTDAGTWPAAALLTGFAIVTAAAALIAHRAAAPSTVEAAWQAAGASAYIALLALDATAPIVLAARALAEERERGTLDLLLTTALPARAIVAGKALGAAARVALPSTAALPILALSAAAGGIPPPLLAAGALILALTTIVGAALGALIGSAVRSRALATAGAVLAACAILTSAPIAATLSLGAARALSDGVPAGVGTSSPGLWAAAGGVLACTHPFAAVAATAAIWQRHGTLGVFTA